MYNLLKTLWLKAGTTTVKIVTDSSADLPKDVAEKLGITVVPLNVRFGTESYRDGVDMTADEFHKRLAGCDDLPVISAPAPGLFTEVYRSLAKETGEIVSIHISSKLSRTYEAALAGKRELQEMLKQEMLKQVQHDSTGESRRESTGESRRESTGESRRDSAAESRRESTGESRRDSAAESRRESTGECRIEVIDCRQATMALGLLAVVAAKAAMAGASAGDMVKQVNEGASRVFLAGMLDTLKFLEKSGQISGIEASMGAMLNIKPVLSIQDGEVVPLERVRGRPAAIKRLYELLEDHLPAQEIGVVHSGCPGDVQELLDRIEKLRPGGKVYEARFGPALGTYVGPGALAIVVLK